MIPALAHDLGREDQIEGVRVPRHEPEPPESMTARSQFLRLTSPRAARARSMSLSRSSRAGMIPTRATRSLRRSGYETGERALARWRCWRVWRNGIRDALTRMRTWGC